jgi:spore coat polysaccharide biosynthesis protein SpsF
MLAFLLDRLQPLPVDQVVVATSDLDRDDPVAEAAEAAGVGVVRGPEQDVLARFALALRRYPAAHVVRITGDCPLTDPAIVAASIDLHIHRSADYTCNVLPRTFPQGLDVEVIAADALRLADQEARLAIEREHVTPFFYRHPERFRLANLRSGEDLGDERWTVDTPSDLEVVRDILRRVGPDPAFGWRDALGTVRRRASTPRGAVRRHMSMAGSRHSTRETSK